MQGLHPDAPNAPNVADASWQGIRLPDDTCQGTYRSQRTVYRQCEFRRSSPGHPASGRRTPRHMSTRRGVSGHFPSRRSCVFQTQPCNLDAAVASGRSRGFWLQRVASCHTTHWRHSCHGGGVITAKTSITHANTQQNPVLFLISNVHLYMLPHSGIQRKHISHPSPARCGQHCST
jgi:hypothetical protein